MKQAIRHMVVFKLKHAKGSAEEAKFLQDSEEVLGAIPFVQHYAQCVEVSPKNGFDYVFSFEFANNEDYQSYNVHPDHVKYVQERWLPEVADFMEIDLQEM